MKGTLTSEKHHSSGGFFDARVPQKHKSTRSTTKAKSQQPGFFQNGISDDLAGEDAKCSKNLDQLLPDLNVRLAATKVLHASKHKQEPQLNFSNFVARTSILTDS